MDNKHHTRAGNVLTYVLVLGDYQSWQAASALWATMLSNKERAALAFAALKSLPYEQAVMTANAAINGEV